ncbi:MAG: intermembrane transport protein PqiB [Lysobacterales bacterium]
MSNTDNDVPPLAKVAPLRRISPLWLIPLVTLLVGAWMVYDDWSKQGPLITIEFSTAEGLEEGVTKVKTRDVEVGQVEKITLNAELNGVLVTARLNNEFRDLLVEGSRFWVVAPTISLSGISGLGTLMTGQYIRFSPGKSGKKVSRFRGLDSPPLTPMSTPGLHLTLTTDGDFSFAKGDLIHYKGINVGKVEDVEFNFSESKIYYNVFITAPYHQLIGTETRFWKASGIRVEMTSTGIQVEAGPIDSLLLGGISFSIPEGQFVSEPVAENSLFYIYPSRSAIFEKKYLFAIQYWVLVKDSIGGVSVGAPVVHRGLQVGKVLRTDYIPEGRNLLDKTMDIPILIEINPGRLGLPDSEESLVRATADINIWIMQGLVATIKTQNFLLGSQLVNLQYEEGASQADLSYFKDLVVIPTGVDSLEKFTESIEAFIAKINHLPLESVVDKLDLLLDEGAATLVGFQQLAKSGESLIGDERTTELLVQLTDTLNALEETAQSFANDSKTNQELQRTLQSISAFLKEMIPLITELKNRPSGLVYPTSPHQETEPARKQQ